MSGAVPDRRPSQAAELRAWIGVGVVLVVHAVGGVWWAATLSAEVRGLRELVSRMEQRLAGGYTGAEAQRDLGQIHRMLQDHEERVRALEKVRAGRGS